MQRFFTSDLHLGHTNIIGFCNRPYGDAEEMNEDLVRRWNTVVGPDDEVWIIGDLAMGHLATSLGYAEQMNGSKTLVPGNHDRMFKCLGRRYAYMCERYEAVGIKVYWDTKLIRGINGVAHLVCHFPYQGDSKEGHEDRYQEMRPKDQGMRLIHGHTHGSWRKRGRMVDVGVDAWGGYPVPFETVAELFNSPEEARTDFLVKVVDSPGGDM